MSVVAHVRSRFDWDCGVASICMLIGMRYEVVASVVPTKSATRRGLFVRELKSLAEELTGRRWVVRRALPYGPLIAWADWPGQRALLVLKETTGDLHTHAVVLDGEILHDPEYRRSSHRRGYRRRNWRLTSMIYEAIEPTDLGRPGSRE